jgi:hypothetical protein
MFSRRKPKPVSLSDDLRTTRKKGVRTAILVTLLISGFAPAVSMFFRDQSDIPFSIYARQMWTVVLQTYPLTVAVAIITLSRKQKWLRWGKWVFAASVIAACAAVGNSLGEVTGHGVIEPGQLVKESSNPVFGVPASGVNYLAGFYSAYGLRTFLASILVGVFAGSTASTFMRHVPKETRDVIDLAQELNDARRSAA